MGGWRNQAEGGSGRTDDSRGPGAARPYQAAGPGDHDWSGRAPTPDGSRQGVDVRMNRRLHVTAS
ncbi:hypothetical protein ACIRU8_39340 [Streptomyces sp. NPDC101175]|uniref:hypothetical protein n=1 Tax=Streptomyces sp. NPDC101175 TaxID=3366123 RepID=UPI00383948AF